MDLNDLHHETNELAEQNKAEIAVINQDAIVRFMQRQTKKVLDGEADGYKLALFLKNLEGVIATVKKQITPTVLDEISEGFDWNGFKFEKTQSGRYEYKHSEAWVAADRKKKDIEETMKQVFKTGKTIIDEDTGEVYESAIYKANSESYKISKNRS